MHKQVVPLYVISYHVDMIQLDFFVCDDKGVLASRGNAFVFVIALSLELDWLLQALLFIVEFDIP